MDGKSLVTGRFFKFLIPGFETSLKLPPIISKKLDMVDLNSTKVVLNSCKGSWEVGVRKCSDGLLHLFGESWEAYVKDHELEVGQCIVFEQTGRLRFNTIVYDETCCEMDFDALENEEGGKMKNDMEVARKFRPGPSNKD